MVRQTSFFYADILRAIRLIQEFTADSNAMTFLEDLRTYIGESAWLRKHHAA